MNNALLRVPVQVATNRLVALLVSGALVFYKSKVAGTTEHPMAPLSSFFYHSSSNVLSAYAQYEALKYVTFPTQTLSKSCKIIPVMLIGKYIHSKDYSAREYAEALTITLGSALFFLNEKQGSSKVEEDSTLGLCLLAMYLTCDAFTSQWQSKVYKNYKIDQFQMMFGTNGMSLILTGGSLLYTGDVITSLKFMALNPASFWHVLASSLSGAMGQLFIFYTIKRFGPVVFTIIMTTRQIFSMILSCFIYGHTIGPIAKLSCLLVFGTLGMNIRKKYLAAREKDQKAADGGGDKGVSVELKEQGKDLEAGASKEKEATETSSLLDGPDGEVGEKKE